MARVRFKMEVVLIFGWVFFRTIWVNKQKPYWVPQFFPQNFFTQYFTPSLQMKMAINQDYTAEHSISKVLVYFDSCSGSWKTSCVCNIKILCTWILTQQIYWGIVLCRPLSTSHLVTVYGWLKLEVYYFIAWHICSVKSTIFTFMYEWGGEGWGKEFLLFFIEVLLKLRAKKGL